MGQALTYASVLPGISRAQYASTYVGDFLERSLFGPAGEPKSNNGTNPATMTARGGSLHNNGAEGDETYDLIHLLPAPNPDP